MSNDVSPAVVRMSAQMAARVEIRKRWKDDAGDLIDAHQFAFSAVCSMTDRFSGRRFARQPKSIEGRMSLTAQFIQGVDICETAISEGLFASCSPSEAGA